MAETDKLTEEEKNKILEGVRSDNSRNESGATPAGLTLSQDDLNKLLSGKK
ncbi:MAG: hypothetical protein IKQ13_00305 [Treponema sp.]|nr:hypothetical protein [Treponema sp.]MBR4245417.1 hypothetical protein [Treponema sp.]